MRIRDLRHTVLIFLAVVFCSTRMFAQKDSLEQNETGDKPTNLFSIGLGLQYGSVFAHSPTVENTKGSHPRGAEIILSWQRNDRMIWNLCNCYPRKGLLLAYYNYDSEVLGKSFTAAYFLEPTYRLRKNLFFSFRTAAGLSYLTSPFDSIRHPNNRSYSTNMNVYLLVGLGVWFTLGDHWLLNPSINYNHESNGGMKQPNSGINWPTAGLTLSYQRNPSAYYTGARVQDKSWKNNSIRWDIGLFGTARRVLDRQGDSKRLPLLGLSFQAGKQVGRINQLTIGTEFFHDWGLRYEFNKDTIAASPVKAGLLFGHEFLLGKFLFSQRLGLYLFDQTPDFDRLYHRWGILYRINRLLAIGAELSAHRHIADFTNLKMTYTIQNR